MKFGGGKILPSGDTTWSFSYRMFGEEQKRDRKKMHKGNIQKLRTIKPGNFGGVQYCKRRKIVNDQGVQARELLRPNSLD